MAPLGQEDTAKRYWLAVRAFTRLTAIPMLSRKVPTLQAASGGALRLYSACFSDMDNVLIADGIASVDGVVLDIGVSSMQLDRAERGFSFQKDGPLDMRMAQDGMTAADFVNEAEEAEIADIIYRYGEEHRSRRIAR